MRYTSYDYGDRANYIRYIAKNHPQIHSEALEVISRVRQMMDTSSLKDLHKKYTEKYEFDVWVFIGLCLKHVYPEVYESGDTTVRLGLFTKPIADVLGIFESNASVRIAEARFHIQRPGGIRDIVDEIYNSLGEILALSPEINGQKSLFE